MTVALWMLFVLALKLPGRALAIVADEMTENLRSDSISRQNDKYSDFPQPYRDDNEVNYNNYNRYGPNASRCSRRLENALEVIRRRQQAKFARSALDLAGYSLHQPLRSIPYDMYVTDMRVRLPASMSWVRVDRCYFNPINTSLETRLLFNDLTISGNVNLYRENDQSRERPKNPESCGMILRLRKAGIGFYTEPIRRERGQFNVRTDSHFLEPGFISVYAYGCEPKMREHRRIDAGHRDDFYDLEKDDVSREMEDIFLNGIRSLLTTYMQKELQPAIKETLMTNMGYTISYGR